MAERAKPGFRRFFSRRRVKPEPAASPVAAPSPASVCLVTVSRGDGSDLFDDLIRTARAHIAHWLVAETAEQSPARQHVEAAFAPVPGGWIDLPGADPVEARSALLSRVPASATHVLLLDPDMTLDVSGSLSSLLGAAPGDAFLVRVDDNGYRHRRPLLLRARMPWSFVDDSRSSVSCEVNFVTVGFDPARVARRSHGTRIANTLCDDRDRLYRRIEADPSHVPTMFHLAKTLADLGETDPALWWFTKCATTAGRGEEAYCAWYFAGELHLLANNPDAASSAFMRALQARPARAEAYYQLALINQTSRDFPMARMWAEAGMLQRPTPDSMWVQPWMRRWGLPFQWALAAWWTGDARAARTMMMSLVDAGLLPEPYASQASALVQRALPGGEKLRYA